MLLKKREREYPKEANIEAGPFVLIQFTVRQCGFQQSIPVLLMFYQVIQRLTNPDFESYFNKTARGTKGNPSFA